MSLRSRGKPRSSSSQRVKAASWMARACSNRVVEKNHYHQLQLDACTAGSRSGVARGVVAGNQVPSEFWTRWRGTIFLLLRAERETEVGTCALTEQAGVSAVQSQMVTYRAKAKEFARLRLVAKSHRHSRQYRKLAEMYWALALGEEPDRAQPSKPNVKRNTT